MRLSKTIAVEHLAALAGRRILVVGASSGIGRAVGTLGARAGASVALAGRRRELLEDAAVDAGPGAVPVVGDVRDEASCAEVVDAAVTELGALDAVVYAAAHMGAGYVVETSAAEWRQTFETNVIGAALVTRFALPHLTASRGRAVYLSSDSVLRARPGVLPYVSSKAALDSVIGGLREEVPEVEFTRVLVGPTHGTDIASRWDPALRTRLKGVWAEGGWLDAARMTIEECATEVLHVLAAPVHVADVLLQPPRKAEES
jgi:NAD(P)-dependent dehydrogenase (short-subunit alcohol dehydrogenase family)